MKVIGITGGVGAGKSAVLEILRSLLRCRILIADEAAHEAEAKGQPCYDELIEILGSGIIGEDGEIDRKKMAAKIFEDGNDEVLKKVNAIVHPRVKEYILRLIDESKKEGKYDWFFIEAALLIEDGYKAICDELWYVYAPENVRAARLKESRGYSDEKIKAVMESQNDDETFRENCDRVIINDGDLNKTRENIENMLKTID
ncbi:MAG: dephospho-CoA kinase [Lachnospiraceae bacterium]|nr:dephospho-CoA kinase [Lachnospiraceae bacterium]